MFPPPLVIKSFIAPNFTHPRENLAHEWDNQIWQTVLYFGCENVLECVLYNFHTQRKQKDVVCRGWVLNPRPSNY